MTPKTKDTFNNQAHGEGILIILNKSGFPCVVPADQISRMWLDSDDDICLKISGDTNYYRGNFEIFLLCYLAAKSEGGIYDLRDVCNIRQGDTLYRDDLAGRRDKETVDALKSRVRRLTPSDFSI